MEKKKFRPDELILIQILQRLEDTHKLTTRPIYDLYPGELISWIVELQFRNN